MVKKDMFAVVIITKNGEEEYELANFSEMAADAARRIYFERHGKDATMVQSLEKIGAMKIEDIPLDFRVSWPEGAKTIPIYYFRVD